MERCLRNHYITFGGKWCPRTEKWQFSTLPSHPTEVGGHIVMSWGFPSIHVVMPFSHSFQDHHTLSKCNPKSINYNTFIERFLRNHYIKFGGKLTPLEQKKKWWFSTPLQLSNWWQCFPWCHYWETPWLLHSQKLTLWYQFSHDFNPESLWQRIVIPRPECSLGGHLAQVLMQLSARIC